jgi:hypothetical protein
VFQSNDRWIIFFSCCHHILVLTLKDAL